ncbi:hypothetical protein B9G98_00830 [Wickerhamiella sorbophila]|uniref:Uncharacterized protein n=1 Tax=Wickerhamiella sorbophila TaxID=45607 RepID=A0A2T0FE18_9ASCO|nr:hypothetical protein B9G98_00830 [Wickerhamiella sorbophila]PRT53210.1 hypothetical protein B9G98_00830 [Wickerhamiella sorbophila]
MQFLSLAIAQALLATAMAVPVANSLFSLTAFDAELFPEGKALTAKADGTIWLAAPNGEEQLLVASLSEDNLIHGLQVRPDHSLVAGTAGNDSFTLTSDASLTEHGVNKATVCVAQNGEAQMFWGDAVCDNKHAVTVRANPITEASVDNLHLKNNFCFCGGCSRNQAPKCAPPPQRAPPLSAPAIAAVVTVAAVWSAVVAPSSAVAAGRISSAPASGVVFARTLVLTAAVRPLRPLFTPVRQLLALPALLAINAALAVAVEDAAPLKSAAAASRMCLIAFAL